MPPTLLGQKIFCCSGCCPTFTCQITYTFFCLFFFDWSKEFPSSISDEQRCTLIILDNLWWRMIKSPEFCFVYIPSGPSISILSVTKSRAVVQSCCWPPTCRQSNHLWTMFMWNNFKCPTCLEKHQHCSVFLCPGEQKFPLIPIFVTPGEHIVRPRCCSDCHKMLVVWRRGWGSLIVALHFVSDT